MRWVPAGLPAWVQPLASAMEKQFAPLLPSNPPRVPAIAEAKLTAEHAARNPYGLAVNTDTGALVVSTQVAGAFAWRNADGSAL